MKILFLAAEVGPFVSIGGLSQVIYFLPRALIKLGHEVDIFTPRYGNMLSKSPQGSEWKFTTEVENLRVPIDLHVKDNNLKEHFLQCNVKKHKKRITDPTVYLLENREYYEMRANVFGYKDDHVRFSLLSKGCLEWLRTLKKSELPDIIHCNDWHTSYFIELARKDRRYKEMMASIPILLSIHNFHFQGNKEFKYLSKSEKDNAKKELAPLLSPELLNQNALLRGIIHADSVSTVSPTHALEIITPEYGEGLEETLQKVRGKITGILNGIDIQEFNPATDPIINTNYNSRNASKKRTFNKLDLQKKFGLKEDSKQTIIFVSGRISGQKGWDIMISIFPKLLEYDENIQIIVLGEGDEKYKKQLYQLQIEYPERVGLHLRRDFRLPRKLFSGGDIILIPSNFEPGGIVALEALRYGAVPIVRRTGGLADIVSDFNIDTKEGNGFSFKKSDSWSFFGKVVEAITVYKQKQIWNKLVQNCMTNDFSWSKAAKEYVKLYKSIIDEKKRSLSLVPHPVYKNPVE